MFLGPLHFKQDSWQLRQIPSLAYFDGEHSATQYFPSLTLVHSWQSSALGPEHELLHSGLQSPQFLSSI